MHEGLCGRFRPLLSATLSLSLGQLVQRAESYLDNSCHKRLALISPTKRLSQILIKEIYKEQESFF